MIRFYLHALRGMSGFACIALTQFALPAGLAAQPSRSPITLGAIVEQLERSSPMLAAARAAAAAANARIGPVRALPDPRAQLAVMNRMLPGLTTMSPLAMDQLTVMQMLPLASRQAAIRAAEAKARATESGIATQRVAARRDAAEMLADWWQADAARAVMDETRGLLRESTATAEAMYRAGQAKQSEVLRMQAELTRMTAGFIAMDAMRRKSAASLSAMLDAPLNADSLQPALPAVAPESAKSTPNESAELKAAHLAVDAAAAEEAKMRRERWPDLEVGLQLGQRPGTSERMVSVMAGAAIPLFARQRQLQAIEEMSAMRRMADADARNVAAANRAAMTDALSAVERSRELQRLYDGTLLPQLTAALESAAAAYRAGSGSLDAMLGAMMSLNDARISRLTARADEVRALARLEQLTGRAWLAVPLTTERHP